MKYKAEIVINHSSELHYTKAVYADVMSMSEVDELISFVNEKIEVDNHGKAVQAPTITIDQLLKARATSTPAKDTYYLPLGDTPSSVYLSVTRQDVIVTQDMQGNDVYLTHESLVKILANHYNRMPSTAVPLPWRYMDSTLFASMLRDMNKFAHTERRNDGRIPEFFREDQPIPFI